jgi:ATP-binding cassette, subfamily B, bacterial
MGKGWAPLVYQNRKCANGARKPDSAIAEESLSNAQLVQAYNQQVDEVDRFSRKSLSRFFVQMASTGLKALYGLLVDSLELARVFAVVGLGTWHWL